MFRVEQIMGMPIEIDVRDSGVNSTAIDGAFAWFRWADAVFSTYRADSQISRLNAGYPLDSDASETVQGVLRRCEELKIETGGYFDIATEQLPIPVHSADGAATRRGVDPSGLVKGWSVDRAGEILEKAGARNYSINAGGDIRVRGGALPEALWRVGIRHPIEHDQIAAVVEAGDLAIATSGAYERGQHILDPYSGRPPDGVLSVTIVGPDLAAADAYATAAFAMGEEGPRWTMSLEGYESLTILDERTVLSTPGFPKQ